MTEWRIKDACRRGGRRGGRVQAARSSRLEGGRVIKPPPLQGDKKGSKKGTAIRGTEEEKTAKQKQARLGASGLKHARGGEPKIKGSEAPNGKGENGETKGGHMRNVTNKLQKSGRERDASKRKKISEQAAPAAER